MSDEKNAISLQPRAHNTLSYAGAALVMLLLTPRVDSHTWLFAGLWVLHFLRRTGESLFVHRYSGRPIAPADYLGEYAYYWGFATWIALGLRAPAWHPPSPPFLWLGLVIFATGELGNTWAHLKLRELREASGQDRRAIPHGGLFAWVSCPHYLFEILSWVGFALLTRVWGAYAFAALGSGILTSYAWSRHQKYKTEFDGQDGRELYPPHRKALVPFIL